jgi:membrane fusion protein
MSVVPTASELRAELYVPSSSIGFLKIGQEVSVALDPFPYQRFGTVPAEITTIASAPVLQSGGNSNSAAVYIVTASLKTEKIMAYGAVEDFLPGMTLTARITTEKQSLLRWLFDPIFAVRKR